MPLCPIPPRDAAEVQGDLVLADDAAGDEIAGELEQAADAVHIVLEGRPRRQAMPEPDPGRAVPPRDAGEIVSCRLVVVTEMPTGHQCALVDREGADFPVFEGAHVLTGIRVRRRPGGAVPGGDELEGPGGVPATAHDEGSAMDDGGVQATHTSHRRPVAKRRPGRAIPRRELCARRTDRRREVSERHQASVMDHQRLDPVASGTERMPLPAIPSRNVVSGHATRAPERAGHEQVAIMHEHGRHRATHAARKSLPGVAIPGGQPIDQDTACRRQVAADDQHAVVLRDGAHRPRQPDAVEVARPELGTGLGGRRGREQSGQQATGEDSTSRHHDLPPQQRPHLKRPDHRTTMVDLPGNLNGDRVLRRDSRLRNTGSMLSCIDGRRGRPRHCDPLTRLETSCASRSDP
jgi:hypothetical protein